MWLELICLFPSKLHSANNIRLGLRGYAHMSQTEFASCKNSWYSRTQFRQSNITGRKQSVLRGQDRPGRRKDRQSPEGSLEKSGLNRSAEGPDLTTKEQRKGEWGACTGRASCHTE